MDDNIRNTSPLESEQAIHVKKKAKVVEDVVEES